MIETQQFQNHITIYGWPKALAASMFSWSGTLVATITDIPWTGIFMAVCGIIPPILKIIFDNRLRSQQSNLEYIARLTKDREEQVRRAKQAEDELEKLIDHNNTIERSNQAILDSVRQSGQDIEALKNEVSRLKAAKGPVTDEQAENS
jgi:septal ring factor EnvC (AmiA/AmiB activator)